MSIDDSFDDVMRRLRGGDGDAAAEVFRRYAWRLIGLARTHLDARVRQKVDPEDVAQSALKSFFLRTAGGEFDVAGWNGLWALLVVITVRKCGRQTRRYRTAGRDLEQEQAAAGWEPPAGDPSPEAAAMLVEQLEGLLRAAGHERHRQILELRLQGYEVPEIADAVGRSQRTVQRVLEWARERLEGETGPTPPAG